MLRKFSTLSCFLVVLAVVTTTQPAVAADKPNITSNTYVIFTSVERLKQASDDSERRRLQDRLEDRRTHLENHRSAARRWERARVITAW